MKPHDIIEQVKALTKEELLALFLSDRYYFSWSELDQKGIDMAKGTVVRAKADAAFAKYIEISGSLPEPPSGTLTLEQHIALLKSIQEGEQWYKKYTALTARADKLQFGRSLNRKGA